MESNETTEQTTKFHYIYKVLLLFLFIFHFQCRRGSVRSTVVIFRQSAARFLFLLGVLCRCNYCENGPVLDSNQYLLLANPVRHPFTPTCLKLLNLSISYRSRVLSCSSGFHLSSQVYVEQVELLVRLTLCTIYFRLFSLNLLT